MMIVYLIVCVVVVKNHPVKTEKHARNNTLTYVMSVSRSGTCSKDTAYAKII